MKAKTLLLLAAATLCLLRQPAVAAEKAEAIDIGSRLELFVDRHLIDSMQGVSLKQHHPVDAGEAMKFDLPWEGPYCAYCTVIKDGDTYRMYYRGQASVVLGDGEPTETTCYA